ncbi:MAG: hypothetical protein R3F48_04220 [Candidatus Zixiibacteriota bacterium]
MAYYYRETPEDRLEEKTWLPYIVFAVVTAILSWPIITTLSNWGIRDWDLFTTLHASVVRSIVEYGQFPFWNPYIGGGNILFAHPEVPVLNPVVLLYLVFGPLIGLKIQLLLAYYCGFIGTYKLARAFGISIYGSYIPPLVFMLSSYFALHFSAGHIPFHYFAALPWLVFVYKKSLDNPWYILWMSAITAFMILGSGAAVPVVFSLFFLFLFSLFDLSERNRFWPPLYAIAGGVGGVLIAAVKFLPMADYLSRHPWVPDGTVMTTPLSLLPTMLFNFNQSMFSGYAQGYVWGWHEYGAYLGPLAVILVAIGLLFAFKRTWSFLVLAVFSLLLVLGSFASWAPWELLHKLPAFESMRVPSRFIILALFALAFIAGIGLDRLIALFKFRRGAMTILFFIAIAGTHLLVSLPILGEAFTREAEQPEIQADFRQIQGDPNRMYAAFLANEGTVRAAWLSAYRGGRGIFDGQEMQEWYSEGEFVQVIDREFSPNRLVFHVRTAAGGQLVVGQGYDPGWRRADDGAIKEFHDLLSFRVYPHDERIELYYRPDYFAVGLIVSIVSALLAIAAPIVYRKLSS